MPFARTPPGDEPGDNYRCVKCNAVCEPVEVYVAANGTVLTHCCGAPSVKIDPDARGQRTIAARWTEQVARYGFVAWPTVVLDLWPALGLESFDLHVLLLLETYRRTSEPVWPSERTIARRAGVHERTVRRSLARIEATGLIERRRERDPDTGLLGSNRTTRDGLTEAADYLACIRPIGNELPTESVTPMLRRLAQRAYDRLSRDGGRAGMVREAGARVESLANQRPQPSGDHSTGPSCPLDPPEDTPVQNQRTSVSAIHRTLMSPEVEADEEEPEETDSSLEAPTRKRARAGDGESWG